MNVLWNMNNFQILTKIWKNSNILAKEEYFLKYGNTFKKIGTFLETINKTWKHEFLLEKRTFCDNRNSFWNSPNKLENTSVYWNLQTIFIIWEHFLGRPTFFLQILIFLELLVFFQNVNIFGNFQTIFEKYKHLEKQMEKEKGKQKRKEKNKK